MLQLICPKQDLNLGTSKFAVFESCKATALITFSFFLFQVQASFKEKDDQINLLNQQLKTSWTTLASVKKVLNIKSAQLDKLTGNQDKSPELVNPLAPNKEDSFQVLEKLENEISAMLKQTNGSTSKSFEAQLAEMKAEIMKNSGTELIATEPLHY